MEEFKDLPLRLEDWTYETIEHLVKTREFEPGTFDYKDALNPTGNEKYKEEHRDSIRRTVCSMANVSGGGFIIFGVKDRKNVKETDTIEDRIIGIPPDGELLRDFGSKIAAIQPDVHCEPILRAIDVPHAPGRVIFVVRIPQSQRRPHMVFFEGGRGGIYYKRGEHGAAVPMTHAEVQEQMMYTEDRMQRVILLRLEVMQYKDIALEAQSRMNWTLDRFDVSAFKVLLAEVCSLIPSNLLQKALNIPRQASVLNKHLENLYGKHYTKLDQGELGFLRSDVSKFIDLCTECEKALASLFGPLS